MVLLIYRKPLRKAALIIAAVVCCAAVLTSVLHSDTVRPAVKTVELNPSNHIIIIDPGHGGEDGGAVAADGTVESKINLEIAQKMYFLFRFCGQSCGMTRNRDISTYSGGAKTLREKKVSDLKNRVALVNRTSKSFLVSIHQNYLPSAGVHGAQVFYNAEAQDTGKRVQASLNSTVNVEKKKSAKVIAPSIYLMKNIKRPGILVECGFLSNPSETEKLKSSTYQILLAASIASGFLNC